MKEILVISIATPLLIGVYENKKLIKTYEKEGMTSDVLPLIFDEILKENDVFQNHGSSTRDKFVLPILSYYDDNIKAERQKNIDKETNLKRSDIIYE